MGDMAETFSAMRAHNKARRAAVYERNLKTLMANSVFMEQSKGVWRFNGLKGTIMYYPASGRVMFKSQVVRMPATKIDDWLIAEGHKCP